MRHVGIIGRAGHGKDSVADVLVTEYGYRKMPFAGPLKEFCRSLFGLTHADMSDPVMKESWLCRHDWPFRNRGEFRARVPEALSGLLRAPLDIVRAAAAGSAAGGDDAVTGLPIHHLCQSVSDRLAIYIEPLIFLGDKPSALFAPTPRILLQVVGTEVFRGISPTFWTRVWERDVRSSDGHGGGTAVVAPDVRFMSEVNALRSVGAHLVRVVRPDKASISARSHLSETALLDLHVEEIRNDGSLEDLRAAVRSWFPQEAVLRFPAAPLR